MLVLGSGLVLGYAVQICYIMRGAALERRTEGRIAAVEKAD
jgi:hypothetical protein